MWPYKSTFPPAMNTYLLAYTITNTYQTVHFFFSQMRETPQFLCQGFDIIFMSNDGIIILHKAHSIKQSSTVM